MLKDLSLDVGVSFWLVEPRRAGWGRVHRRKVGNPAGHLLSYPWLRLVERSGIDSFRDLVWVCMCVCVCVWGRK